MKFSGTTLPGPARSSKDSTALKENPACGGPDSRDRSTAKSFRGVDSSIAHRIAHRVAHKDNPAHGGPDSMDRSTAHPSCLTNPSDPTEGDPPKQEGDHPPRTPPKTPPVPTPQGKPERLEAKLTPLQKRRLKTLKEKGKTTKVPSSLTTLDTSSKKFPKKPKGTPPSTVTDTGVKPLSEPTSPKSPKSAHSITSESSSSERSPSPIPTMGTVKELADALTDKLKDIGRHPTISYRSLEVKREKILMIIA